MTLGILASILAALLFTLMDVSAKAVSYLGTGELTFVRGLVGLFFLPLIAKRESLPLFSGKDRLLLHTRGIFGGMGILLFFFCLKGLTLGDAEILVQLAAFFIIVWEVPKGSGKIGIINQNTEAGWLPVLGGQRYLLPILLVAILTGVMYIYLNYSKHGYEIAVVGESQRTASYAGIKVERVIVRTMILSGAICGLIGLLLTAGTDHTLTTTIVGGRGFTAVMVSWMAKFNPIMMIFTSLLIVVLSRGASEISSVFGLNHSFADILTGIILFFIIGSEFFISYKVSLRKSKKEA